MLRNSVQAPKKPYGIGGGNSHGIRSGSNAHSSRIPLDKVPQTMYNKHKARLARDRTVLPKNISICIAACGGRMESIMKKYVSLLLLLLTGILCTSLAACEDSDIPDETASKKSEIVIAEKGKGTDFRLVYPAPDNGVTYACVRDILRIRTAIDKRLDVNLRPSNDMTEVTPYEIVVGAMNRPACADLTATLAENEYAIRAVKDEFGCMQIVIAYKGAFARMAAIDRFITEYVTDERAAVPEDLDVRGSCSEADAMITSTIPALRDPCILVVDGVYYAYGTGWGCYKNTSGSLSGDWEYLGCVVQIPEAYQEHPWAPEVYFYNGAYYMFTTYRSSLTGHRGCTVMRSDSPEGPFVEISNGHITPADWDAIDGTLYVDEEGQPWMVFVHEWTSLEDGIGRMAAAKLSDDLTHFISEPIELFTAHDASWAKGNITDGCWLYRCENGELIMLWSNGDASGYAVGIARSDNGRIDGNWTQDSALLYSQGLTDTYDGGHGMIFTDTDGQMYLSIHSPNGVIGERREQPTFIPIREQDGSLVWDLWDQEK